VATDADTILLDYSNHYNKKENRCFILVQQHLKSTGGVGSWANNMNVWDVYENSKIADFSEGHLVGFNNATDNSLYTCEIYGSKCKSADEFENLIRPSMSN